MAEGDEEVGHALGGVRQRTGHRPSLPGARPPTAEGQTSPHGPVTTAGEERVRYGVTVVVRVTGSAGRKYVLPGCVAVTVHVSPAVRKVIREPAIVHPPEAT